MDRGRAMAAGYLPQRTFIVAGRFHSVAPSEPSPAHVSCRSVGMIQSLPPRACPDISDAMHFRSDHSRNGAPSLHFQFNAQLSPGSRAPEFRAFNARKNITLLVVLDLGEQQRPPPAQSLPQSNARMIGNPGKCPLKNGSLIVTFLIATMLLSVSTPAPGQSAKTDSDAAESSGSRECRAPS